MAKFDVTVMHNVQVSKVIRINVLRDEVVDEMGLEGEARADWRDYVEDFVNANPERLTEGELMSSEPPDESEDFDVQDVQDA